MPKKDDTVVDKLKPVKPKRAKEPDLPERMEIRPGSPEAHKLAPGLTHHPIYDGFCAICTSPMRLSIERAYESDSIPKVAARFGLKVADLELHVQTLDLDIDRLDKTDRTAAKIQEVGYRRLEEGLEAVTVDHLIRLSEHKDKKEGRITTRVAITKPSVIVFRGMVSPLDSLEEADVEALAPAPDEMETPLLPASKVKDVTNE